MTTVDASSLTYLAGLSATEGYQVLSANMSKAVSTFETTGTNESDIAYFEKTVPTLTSVSQFTSNTRLVNFMLDAFGLSSEAQYPALVQQVLTQNPSSPTSLCNQLTDPRFKQLATALTFFTNGLGAIQAKGLPDPTTATSSEPGATVTTPSNGVNVGLGVTGNSYLQIQKPDGSTAYVQSGYFKLNSSGELALSDGSLLVPSFTAPPGSTAITVDSGGDLYAQVPGQTKPEQLGTLEFASFPTPSKLKKDSSGYYETTQFSGAAKLGLSAGSSSAGSTFYAFGNTMQSLVNDYVTNQFETAVGEQNTGVREALYFNRVASSDVKAASSQGEETEADTLLGDTVLRNVVTTATGLPAAIAEQDLTQQQSLFESAVNLSQLASSPSYTKSFVQRYLAEYDATNTTSSSSTSPALQILSAFGGGNSASATTSSAASSILSLVA